MCWDRFIIDVYLCFSLSFSLVWLWSASLTTALCGSLRAWLLSFKQLTLAIGLQVDLPLPKVHECGPLCATCDPLVLLGFLRCNFHHSIMTTTSCFLQVLICNFGCDTQAINEPLLLLNFPLLLGEITLHLLQLFGQKFILLPNFLPCNSQALVFLLSINQVVSDSTEFLLSLIDFIHVAGSFKSAFLDKLISQDEN